MLLWQLNLSEEDCIGSNSGFYNYWLCWHTSGNGKSFDFIQFTLHEKTIGVEEHVDGTTAKLLLGFTWNIQHMIGILFLAVINDQHLKRFKIGASLQFKKEVTQDMQTVYIFSY